MQNVILVSWQTLRLGVGAISAKLFGSSRISVKTGWRFAFCGTFPPIGVSEDGKNSLEDFPWNCCRIWHPLYVKDAAKAVKRISRKELEEVADETLTELSGIAAMVVRIYTIRREGEHEALHLWSAYREEIALCTHCGSLSTKVHQEEHRCIRHLDVGGKKTSTALSSELSMGSSRATIRIAFGYRQEFRQLQTPGTRKIRRFSR